MNWRRTSTARAALVPFLALLVLPLSALGLTGLIGSRNIPGPDAFGSWGAVPGLGATILPQWTLGNFDPRLEGPARGETWPVPAGVSCVPDRSATLTRFHRLAATEQTPRLLLPDSGGGER
jgi:hypothetical protein